MFADILTVQSATSKSTSTASMAAPAPTSAKNYSRREEVTLTKIKHLQAPGP
jgi:hypothetical protein